MQFFEQALLKRPAIPFPNACAKAAGFRNFLQRTLPRPTIRVNIPLWSVTCKTREALGNEAGVCVRGPGRLC